MFQCGTWPLLREREFAKLHAAVLAGYRELTPKEGDAWLSDAAVLRATGLPAPAVLLKRQRLLLFNRVLERAPDDVLVVLAAARSAKSSWLKAVDRDAEWLATRSELFRELAGAGAVGWVAPCRAGHRAMHQAIVKACGSPALSHREQWARATVAKPLGEPVQCADCALSFPSRQAAAVHACKAHGTLRDARRLIRDTHCLACLQLFSTIERVLIHVAEKSPWCGLVYATVVEPMEDAAFDAVQETAREQQRALAGSSRGRTHAEVPVTRLCGPLRAEALAAGVCHRRLLRAGPFGPCGPFRGG